LRYKYEIPIYVNSNLIRHAYTPARARAIRITMRLYTCMFPFRIYGVAVDKRIVTIPPRQQERALSSKKRDSAVNGF